MEIIQVEEWGRWPWLKHGFSVRAGGVSAMYGAGELNLGFTRDDEAGAVAENRRRFVEAVAGEEGARLVAVRQVHGTEVKVVRTGDDGAGVEADGLVTDVAGVMLGVLAADCVPVLVADTRKRVVGAFHAGWRGTAAGMVERGIARMVEEFGADTRDMVGAVGPSIGRCCYVVGEELRREFRGRFGDAEELFEEREDGLHLDLAEEPAADGGGGARRGTGDGRGGVYGVCPGRGAEEVLFASRGGWVYGAGDGGDRN